MKREWPKVHIVPDPVRMQQLVYIELGPASGDERVFATQDDPARTVIVRPGSEPPLYMAIRNEVAEALALALAPRPEATERHLDDAIEVRDRLLTMGPQQAARDFQATLFRQDHIHSDIVRGNDVCEALAAAGVLELED